jgi:hypothetical protein
MDYKKQLVRLLAAYDEADNMRQTAKGDLLAYWHEQACCAEDSIKNIVDDIGPLDSARHMIWSEAL